MSHNQKGGLTNKRGAGERLCSKIPSERYYGKRVVFNFEQEFKTSSNMKINQQICYVIHLLSRSLSSVDKNAPVACRP